jgi:hypothetical protein
MTIRIRVLPTLVWILIIAVCVAVFFFARGLFGQSGFSLWGVANSIENAGASMARGAEGAPTATPDAQNNVRAADVPTPATVVMTSTLPKLSSEALVILSEVDEAIKVEDKTPAYRDFRFGVSDLGQHVAASMVFNTDGAIKMRVVCDDECNGFYLVSVDRTVTALKPDASYGPNYNYQTLDANALKMAADMGINTTDSEILAQHLFYTETSVKPGDQFVVGGNDDLGLGVNRGVFTSWTWTR